MNTAISVIPLIQLYLETMYALTDSNKSHHTSNVLAPYTGKLGTLDIITNYINLALLWFQFCLI